MVIIRFLALVGSGVSAYLVWMKLTGQITSVVGYGAEGGCSNFLEAHELLFQRPISSR